MMPQKSFFVLLSAAAFCTAAYADSVFVGTLERKDVKIQNFRNGQVEFSISGRQVDPVPAEKISKLALDDDAAFTQAERAFADEKWAQAADAYAALIKSPSRPWLTNWILPRWVRAADRAGKFDSAVAAYIQLVQSDAAAASHLRPAIPANANPATLAAATAELSKAASSAALSAAQQQSLRSLLVDTHIAQGDLASAAKVAEQLVKSLPQETKDPVMKQNAAYTHLAVARIALAEKDYAKALNQIQQHRALFDDPNQQAEALYIIAASRDAQAGAKLTNEAARDLAIDYMRVVAAARQTAEKRYLPESILRVAQLQEILGEPRLAMALYGEVATEYKDSPVAAKAVREQQRLKEKAGQ